MIVSSHAAGQRSAVPAASRRLEPTISEPRNDRFRVLAVTSDRDTALEMLESAGDLIAESVLSAAVLGMTMLAR
jgi:hypothetical protein